MSKELVEVMGLSRRFGSTIALAGIDFHVSPGQVHGLVGENGAGKTTLIKHLLGLLRGTSGTVRVFGRDPVRHPVEVLGRIGYLSEERDLPEWMRIEELMRYTRAFHPAWDSGFAGELLDTFGLDRRKRIKDLSKGMRAQVGLVAAVAHRPELLILDEPSSGLDPAVRRDILDAIVRTVANEGRTVLFSSHLLDEIERMSDHLTMIHRGRIVMEGDVETVRQSHFCTHVRFAEPLDRPPEIDGALSAEGDGRSWQVIHDCSVDRVRAEAALQRGEVVESRAATLEEVFLARAGRVRSDSGMHAGAGAP